MGKLDPSFLEIETEISQSGSGAGSLIGFSATTYRLLSPKELVS